VSAALCGKRGTATTAPWASESTAIDSQNGSTSDEDKAG
jgi:hypothetical protein